MSALIVVKRSIDEVVKSAGAWSLEPGDGIDTPSSSHLNLKLDSGSFMQTAMAYRFWLQLMPSMDCRA